MAFNPGSGNGISAASDVTVSNLINDNFLSYNGTTQKWTNKTITSTSMSDFATAVASVLGSKLAAGSNTSISFNPTTGVTTVNSAGGSGGTAGSSNVLILAAGESSPPVNTPVGTIILREVA
jgi:hypothetical protein